MSPEARSAPGRHRHQRATAAAPPHARGRGAFSAPTGPSVVRAAAALSAVSPRDRQLKAGGGTVPPASLPPAAVRLVALGPRLARPARRGWRVPAACPPPAAPGGAERAAGRSLPRTLPTQRLRLRYCCQPGLCCCCRRPALQTRPVRHLLSLPDTGLRCSPRGQVC